MNQGAHNLVTRNYALLASLAAAVLLLPVCALADPRGIGEPPPPLTPESIEAQREQRVEDIKAWLPRLVGRFRYEGVVDLNGDAPRSSETVSVAPTEAPATDPVNVVDPLLLKRVTGLGDCVAIGKGPGVHCVVDIVWEDEGKLWGPVLRGEEPFLSPASTLYGVDAIAGMMRYLQLDKDGLTETEEAFVKGNTLTWFYYTGEARMTRRITRIYARPGSDSVQTTIDIEQLSPTRGWELQSTITFDGRRIAASSGE